MYLNKKELLRHFEIVCKDRISTLIEDSCRGMNCNCDIEKESCNECVFWADGVRNYQLYLGDIAETRKADSKTVKKYQVAWSVRDGENKYQESCPLAENEYETMKDWDEEQLFQFAVAYEDNYKRVDADVKQNGNGSIVFVNCVFENDGDYRHFYGFQIEEVK